MRFIQHGLGEKKEPKPSKKKEKPRILAGDKDYDYSNLGKLKPMKGINPYGSS